MPDQVSPVGRPGGECLKVCSGGFSKDNVEDWGLSDYECSETGSGDDGCSEWDLPRAFKLDGGLREERARKVEVMIETGRFGDSDCLEVLREYADCLPWPNRKIMRGGGRCTSIGLYCQGGFQGITRFAKEYPELARYLNGYVSSKGFKEPWCTLYLARNTSAPLHQDKRNDPKQWVWVVTLGEFQGGGIWVEGDGQVGPVAKVLPNGLVKAGSVEDAQNRAISFEGHRWHATEPWFGKDRWVIVAFTPRDACKIIGQYAEELVGLGFRISAFSYSPDESVDSATISKCNGADETPLGDRYANGDSLEGSADLATISKFNDPGSLGAAISGKVRDAEGTYYEIEFPHLIVGEAHFEGWCNRAVIDHLRSARLCKSLSKELSGLEDVCSAGELCRALSETECQREWYEGLLWDDYLRTSVGAVKALSQEVPLCPRDDSPAEIFLQTRNVSVAEARKELTLWIPSAQEEITSLELTNQAVDRIVTADMNG